jgi:hypothetical protein
MSKAGMTLAWLSLAAGLCQSPRAPSPIFFEHIAIPCRLENAPTPRKHAPETMAGGVAAFDYNNDGHLDIFFANGATMPGLKKDSPKYWNRLFRNDGKGSFTDVTEKAGLAGTGYDTGVAVADYDGDGHKDLFLAGVHRNTLYHNNGDGSFSDVTTRAGLGKPDPKYGPEWAVGAVWFDYDNDSRLDLFVLNYLRWDPATEKLCNDYCHPSYYGGLPNRLYRNHGDGTFTDVSAASGLREHVGKGMGASAADLEGDGHLDLFVTNDTEFNFFFRNLGNARFREMAFEAGVALPEHARYVSGMGTDFRDIDNDGYPDAVFVALNEETFPLYRNTGKGSFVDMTTSSGLAHASRTMGGYSPGIFDFDNDGWKDLFVSCGHVQSLDMDKRVEVDQHNVVFRNLRNGKFEPLVKEAGFESQPPRRHRGAAIGDFDHDGRLDIVVSALSAPAELWMNRSPGVRHWLELALEGSGGNRDAIGARIKVVTKEGAQFNHMTTAVGYASSSAGPVHFGLGASATADLVEIRWPSGKVQQLKGVRADQVLKVKEPAP